MGDRIPDSETEKSRESKTEISGSPAAQLDWGTWSSQDIDIFFFGGVPVND